jgi:N-acetylneuraminic acid mutarotase
MYHGLTEMDGLLFAIGGHSGRARLKSVEFYDPATNQWTTACPMNVARSVAGVTSLGGSIYVAGGYNGKDYLDTVESYDIELNKWLLCPSMNVRRSALGLVAYSGCLYACGGFCGSFQSSVEKYVPGMELWENCVPMPLGKVHFAISCT